MRIKKSVLLWGVGVFFALMFLWRTFFHREDTQLVDTSLEALCFAGKLNSQSAACSFLSRVKALENEIGENNRVLRQMYDTFDAIMRVELHQKTNFTYILQKIDTLMDKIAVNRHQLESLATQDAEIGVSVDASGRRVFVPHRMPRRRVPTSLCPASHLLTQAAATIDMADIYEKLTFENPDGGVWKQGFSISYSNDQWNSQTLQVFVVPHSHQDPGWVKTYDEYFTQQTMEGFEQMLDFLTKHPKMRFIYAEMAFFHRWYDSLTPTKQDQVQKLLQNKQFEIVSGGWVMTDEANSHYYATLEEMTSGHQWLQDRFNYQPKVSWSIDPFGHSSTMPYLWRKMGFRYMLIQRVHYAVKKHLAKNVQLEYVWRQRWDQNGTNDIFCHMMPFYSYDVPHTCGPEPGVCCQFDFMRGHSNFNCPWGTNAEVITDANVEKKALQLLDQYRKKSTLYRNNVVLIPLGDDFRYTTSQEWRLQYENYQKLFDFLNSRKDLHVEVKFATLSEYFMALESRAGVAPSNNNPHSATLPQGYPVLVGDMFTYADRDDHYWSGYFTSRPYHKRLDRYLEDTLRQAEILYSFAVILSSKQESSSFDKQKAYKQLEISRRGLSLFQHHDGITGTAKAYVVNDYEQRLLAAVEGAHQSIQESLNFLSTANVKDEQHKASTRPKIMNLIDLNDNLRDFMKHKANKLKLKDGDSLALYVFNSLGQIRSGLVTIWVDEYRGVSLTNSGNELIIFDVFPYLASNKEAPDGFLLHFLIVDMAPLSLELVMLNVKRGGVSLGTPPNTQMLYYNMNADVASQFFSDFHSKQGIGVHFTLENPQYKLTFDSKTGMLQSVTNKNTRKTSKLSISFMRFGARVSQERSGAYLFLPDGQAQPDTTKSPRIRIVQGEVVNEVIVNLDHVEHHVRLTNTPGPEAVAIDIFNYVDLSAGNENEELIMQISTDVKNMDRYFYTDLNCFQFLRRRTYDKLPLQANVYPMPCGAYMEDDVSKTSTTGVRHRLTVLAAQAQGVASPQVGVFQVWMDRRLQQDDNRGLNEPVLDNRPWTPNKVRLLFEETIMPQTTSEYIAPPKQGHLTATATSNLRSLLHPMQPWHVLQEQASEQKHMLKNINFLTGKGLPCDYHLVNLRSRLSPRDSSVTHVLTLHRQGMSCGSSWLVGTNCEFYYEGAISYKTLFNDLIVKQVSRLSLSQTLPLGYVSDKILSLSAMELGAFQLQF